MMTNIPPAINASLGLILPEGIGRWGFSIASSFRSRKSERYRPAIQPHIGAKITKMVMCKGGSDFQVRQAPARLTSPHQRTVYGLQVSIWAKSFSFIDNLVAGFTSVPQQLERKNIDNVI